MAKLFLIDGEKQYTFEQLLADCNEINTYTPYLHSRNNDPYELFLKIVHSLIYDYSLEVVDGEFSKEELKELGIDEERLEQTEYVAKMIKVSTKEELLQQINSVQKWRLTLYTSGTTGKPKKVNHSFKSLTRNVKKGINFSQDIWAFAYNPTHMAGLQVFFQALLNLNMIVYIFNDDFRQVPQSIREYKVTSISATPTFYRNVISYFKNNVYTDVTRITLGGEKYDPSLEGTLRNAFPNAKIRNVYAATETGSLFASDGEVFKVPTDLRNLVRFSQDDELLLHESLLGTSETLFLTDSWYYTGDIVEVIDDLHFKFLSRESDIINIGGYKVNPLEVENRLKELQGIKDIVVKGRKSSVTGEIIVADVIKNEDVDGRKLKREIKKYASTHLQAWKVPRIIKYVDEIQMTRTGKKVRK